MSAILCSVALTLLPSVPAALAQNGDGARDVGFVATVGDA